MELIISISLIIAFFISLFGTPFWIKKMEEIGFLWNDMNKPGSPKNVASSGGVVVIFAFVLGVLYYIAIRTFVLDVKNSISLEIFGTLSVLLLLALIGIIDDFFGWEKGGLSTRVRLILAFVSSIPLIVINAGVSSMSLPFFGNVEWGLLYPLVLIPIGIAGAATTYNFLAGFNGLETGQGVLVLGFLSIVAYFTGSAWLAVIGLTMVAALIGFYLYNLPPAKVFPGDSLTWCVGALIAIMAILGNFEKVAVIVFIPYVFETFLKSRGKLKMHSFGKPNTDGSLELRYKKFYSLNHIGIYFLKKIKPSEKVYETDVVLFVHAIQLICIGLATAVWLL